MLPQLADITFVHTGGSAEHVSVVLVERGLRRPTILTDASYGTVRLLGLLALLYDPDPPASRASRRSTTAFIRRLCG
ncbi:hypothetical protein OG279_07680 [Streptomyces sp. NBC_01201]|nr:hypothetical protein OG265_28820 [Streptomyces sp. NBC_01208]WSR47503.1 hypothetical protein OG279_07680 [Streptomyces sp. NBC_01201]